MRNAEWLIHSISSGQRTQDWRQPHECVIPHSAFRIPNSSYLAAFAKIPPPGFSLALLLRRNSKTGATSLSAVFSFFIRQICPWLAKGKGLCPASAKNHGRDRFFCVALVVLPAEALVSKTAFHRAGRPRRRTAGRPHR